MAMPSRVLDLLNSFIYSSFSVNTLEQQVRGMVKDLFMKLCMRLELFLMHQTITGMRILNNK